MKCRWFSLLILALVSLCARAEVSISLITSCPSNREIYTLWGHSALLVGDNGKWLLYNYGVFEFSEDFAYKFVSGQTDYCLAVESPKYIVDELKWKNSYGYMQQLNLTQDEARRIVDALQENLKEENRYYRYKFFTDNCATRPQRLLERYVEGIRYVPVNNLNSYRDYIHQLCHDEPWLRLGIDLCLGSGTDEVVPDSMVAFLPVELMRCLDSATIVGKDGDERPLVSEKTCLFTPNLKKDFDISVWETPLALCLVLLFVALVSLLAAVRKATVTPARVFGSIFFLTAGVLGLLIFYLVFFSTHECTSPNFNLLWLNPLHLMTSVLLMVGARNNFSRVWMIVDLLLCACYLLLIAPLPQTTCVEFVVLSIALIISLLAYLWNDRRFFLEKFNKKTLSDKQQIK